MRKQKSHPSDGPHAVLSTLRQLRMMLSEMNAKLDHLIEQCRKVYLTDSISDSFPSEFRH
jgi:hypothetical protein